jgi:hypothetical protein
VPVCPFDHHEIERVTPDEPETVAKLVSQLRSEFRFLDTSKMRADCGRLRSLERGTFRAGLLGQYLDFRAHPAQSSLELSDAHHSLRS